MQPNASYQSSLELGLLEWMSQLILDYIGLSRDEDEEMLKEGSQWLNELDITPAEQWFELYTNIRTYIEFTNKTHHQEKGNESGMFCKILRCLKIGNEKVFDEEMQILLNNAQAEIIKNIISSNSNYLAMDDDSSLSEQQVPVQKRKCDSNFLDFPIEATDNDKEEHIRKYKKVEDEVIEVKLAGKNALKQSALKKGVPKKSDEAKFVENESTKRKMAIKERWIHPL